MTKGLNTSIPRSQKAGEACRVCSKVRKLKSEFCQPCVTRLKQIAGAREDSEYWKIAEILKEGCERERLKLCKKLARGCSEGYDKYKTKIDKVKAEKKAL